MGLGKLVRYIEGTLYRKPWFNEFAEKQPNRSLYRGLANNYFYLIPFFYLWLFFGVTSRYLAFWDRSSLYWTEPYVWTFRLIDSSCIFRSLEMWSEVIIVIRPYKHFISFHVSFWASSELILTFTKWEGLAWETTFVHGPQCNFRLRSTNKARTRYIMKFSYFALLAKRLSDE